jgi:hypothetical protein
MELQKDIENVNNAIKLDNKLPASKKEKKKSLK